MDAISQAVEAAKRNAAAALPQTIDNTPTPGGAVVPMAGRGRSLAEAIQSAGTACDFYLQVKETGIFIDKEFRSPFERLPVTLRLADITSIYAIRYSAAGNIQYGRSIDGIRETRTGQPWQAFCDRCRDLDPKASPYDAFEFVATLTKEVSTKKSAIPVGSTLGHTTSITNYKPFAAWVREMLGVFSETDEIPVNLVHRPMSKGSNNWGIIIPELIKA